MGTLSDVITKLAEWWIARVQRKRLDAIDPQIRIREIKLNEMGMDLSFWDDARVVPVIAVECARMLDDLGAENCVVLDLNPACQLINPIRLTIQWADRKSPMELKREADLARDAAEAEVARLRSRLEEPGFDPNEA